MRAAKVVLLTLLFAGCLAECSSAAKVLARIPLWCPDGTGLCTWTEASGAVPIANLSACDDVLAVAMLVGNRLAIQSRDPNGSVATTIVDSSGAPILSRFANSDSGLTLSATVGSSGAGETVLCGGSPASLQCDVSIAADARKPRIADYPVNCVFPRFYRDESPFCVLDANGEASVWARDPKGTSWSAVLQLEGPVSEILPLGVPPGIALLRTNVLSIVGADGAAVASRRNVLGISQAADGGVWFLEAVNPNQDPQVPASTVGVVLPSGQFDTAWQGPSSVVGLWPVSQDEAFIQVRDPASRPARLIHVSRTPNSWIAVERNLSK